jgi:hypothetical protein
VEQKTTTMCAYDSDSFEDQSENCLKFLFGEILGKYFKVCQTKNEQCIDAFILLFLIVVHTVSSPQKNKHKSLYLVILL